MNKYNKIKNKKSIVIVDDSKIGPILQEILCKERGHQVKLFLNGIDAILQLASDSYFDLSLVDVGLPDMPGEKVISYLKKTYPQRPIICLSSYMGHKSIEATRTIHKGSASRIYNLIDILESHCIV
jgi:CheY-like chemotaxis protein